MKKKIIIVISIVVLLGSIVTFSNTNFYKIHMAELLFGNNVCPANRHQLEVGGCLMTPYFCKICGRKFENSNTNIPVMCEKCAAITSRCKQCGDLI